MLLPGGISEATLRAAITRNGGEKLGPDWPSPLGSTWGWPNPYGGPGTGTSLQFLLPFLEQENLYKAPAGGHPPQGSDGKFVDPKSNKGAPRR